jgi:hypothetical protein
VFNRIIIVDNTTDTYMFLSELYILSSIPARE